MLASNRKGVLRRIIKHGKKEKKIIVFAFPAEDLQLERKLSTTWSWPNFPLHKVVSDQQNSKFKIPKSRETEDSGNARTTIRQYP